jgi:transcriptional regulator
MYIPKHFEITDTTEIFAFIKANAFGQLISSVKGRLFSSHIPFLLSEDKKSLICHIAKQNTQWEDIEGQEVLITFQGPHDYISPSWYSCPGVPTWNYQVVHVYGKPKLIPESENIKGIIEKLTDLYELSNEQPWSPKYKGSLVNVIIGIEIEITNIQCKYKLSQNRSITDQNKVVDELEKRGSVKLSKAMKNRL